VFTSLFFDVDPPDSDANQPGRDRAHEGKAQQQAQQGRWGEGLAGVERRDQDPPLHLGLKGLYETCRQLAAALHLCQASLGHLSLS
jgi:hypothetical protein